MNDDKKKPRLFAAAGARERTEIVLGLMLVLSAMIALILSKEDLYQDIMILYLLLVKAQRR